MKLELTRSQIGALAAILIMAAAGTFVAVQFLREHPNFLMALISGRLDHVVMERQRLHFPRGITDGSFGVPETAVAWNADGSQLATLGKVRATIWDAKSWNKLREISVFEQQKISGRSIAFLPDESLLVPASRLPVRRPETTPNHEALKAWNLKTGNLVHTYPDAERSAPDLVKSINNSNDNFALSRDSKFIAGISFNGLYLYDAATGALLHQWTAPTIPGPPPLPDLPPPPKQSKDGFRAVAVSPDGSEVAVCGFSGRIYLLGAADGLLRRTIEAFDKRKHCTALAYSFDGKFLAASGNRWDIWSDELNVDRSTLELGIGEIRIWRVEDSSLVASFTGMTGDVRTLAWGLSEDILAAGDDGALRMWRVDHNTQQLIFYRRIDVGVARIAFSARGQLACAEERGFDVVIYQ